MGWVELDGGRWAATAWAVAWAESMICMGWWRVCRVVSMRGLEGVVGAAQQEGVGAGGFGEGFEEVDAEDFGGDGVVDPAFFYQWDEEGAGFFGGGEAEGGEGLVVGVGLDCGCGGEDEDVGFLWILRGCVFIRSGAFIGDVGLIFGGLGSGLDYAEDGDGAAAALISGRARAVAVLQAMTRISAP